MGIVQHWNDVLKINNCVVRNYWKIEMVTDIYHISAISYVHMHKIQNHPDKIKAKVLNKVRKIIENLEEIVVGSPTMVDVQKYIILNYKYFGTTTYHNIICFIIHVRRGFVLSLCCGMKV